MGIVRADDGTEYDSWSQLHADGKTCGTQVGVIIERYKMNKKKKKIQCSAAGKIGGANAWGDKKRRSPEHYRAMVEARAKKRLNRS